MGRNSPVSAEVVRLVFTLKNDNGWNLSRIGAHFGKSKTWASQVLTRYSPESLSPNITLFYVDFREKFGSFGDLNLAQSLYSYWSPPPPCNQGPPNQPFEKVAARASIWWNTVLLSKFGSLFPPTSFLDLQSVPSPFLWGHYLLPHPLLRDCSEATFCHKIFCQVLNEVFSNP